ncbi:hypothetical protein [Streptomyces rubiginosohelvolus]
MSEPEPRTSVTEAAVDGSCDEFAADLPPGLVSEDPEELTRLCELMNR